jgi:hypothetical protein
MTKKIFDDDELIARAIERYFRDTPDANLNQPSYSDSFVSERSIIHLWNVHGELAKYQIKSDRLYSME